MGFFVSVILDHCNPIIWGLLIRKYNLPLSWSPSPETYFILKSGLKNGYISD
uniref:Uncharacterized protein n=1 Tax=Picea glauca TaxID=3330 RepID=A0A101LU63_PICGL|nr:hypothetical protein ABT39_MTgene2681 [Picea glauca]